MSKHSVYFVYFGRVRTRAAQIPIVTFASRSRETRYRIHLYPPEPVRMKNNFYRPVPDTRNERLHSHRSPA